jgi:chromosome segregation ATPase
VKPTTSIVFRNIEDQLEKVTRGERRLSRAFEATGQTYAQKSQEASDLNARAAALAGYLREHGSLLEKTEEKLAEITQKIKLATTESENTRLNELKAGVGRLQKELVEMEQKKEILSWELRRHLLRQKNKGKDDYLEINYLEEPQL